MRVLHVAEPTGGGVVTAVMAMVRATPDLEHHLVVWPRRDHDDNGDGWPDALASVRHLPAAAAGARRGLREHVRALRPDVVHAHSSFAGLLARSGVAGRAPVAYSPHCFPFERQDLGALQRRLLTAVERSLATRTDLLVAVSPHELDLAVRLGHREVAYVPNRPLDPVTVTALAADPLHVVSVGRLTPQKDWRYFLHVKRYAEEHLGVRATWEWLGGGERAAEEALAAAGVRVSGWLPRAQLVQRLGRAQVYLHTAAWESAPISILEAAAAGLPLALRGLAPLVSLDLPGTADTLPGLAARIADLQAPRRWAAAQDASLALAGRHSADEQHRRLLTAYARIAAVPGGRPSVPAAAVLAEVAR